jgi:D-alanyl-D-alanine carboxypeptidase
VAVERVHAFRFDNFATALKIQLDGKAVGWAAGAYFLGSPRREAGGLFRTATDGALPASATARHNVADASRPVTAVALLKLLRDRNLTTVDKIHPYLPSSWVKGPNIGQITFRSLLEHQSGITAEGETFEALRDIVKAGIPASWPSIAERHTNLALVRILIAYLSGFKETPGADLAKGTADAYLKYVNEEVLALAGISAVTAKAGVNAPVRAYPNPAGPTAGSTLGDWTLRAGSRGLFLSVDELAKFQHVLWGGDTLLNSDERWRMWSQHLGWAREFPHRRARHGEWIAEGGFVQVNTQGGLARQETVVCVFSTGLRLALTVNSLVLGGGSLLATAQVAHDAAWTAV